MRQNSKFSIAAFGSATNVSTLTASIDTRGFSFARIFCIANTSTGLSTTLTDNILQESDDNATFSTITAAGAGTAYTPTVTTQATNLAKIIYEVDLRGRKRYLKPTFRTNVTTEPIIMVELSNPADGCTTATEIGTAFLSQV